MNYREYSVNPASKRLLLDFILDALRENGCRILRFTEPSTAPFRITFEDPRGEKMGIIAYVFLANSKETKNRPTDEHRFQIKYGSKDGLLHEFWQDPFQLYTTLVCGIDLERDIFVAIDPVLHQLTKFFISIEFKRSEVENIIDSVGGWHWWERTKRKGDDSPVETMVGGRKNSFLRYVRFEQAARGLDQGHRYLLAENLIYYEGTAPIAECQVENQAEITSNKAHRLAAEFEISESEILTMIHAAPRLKMAVRGWVAERHLYRLLENTPGVSSCIQLEEDGRPDFSVRYQESQPILIECKNVLRKTMADGTIRVDFQKTRASKNDPCTRFYKASEFEVLAACLHPTSEKWDFTFMLTRFLAPHKKCEGRLSNLVKIGDGWMTDPSEALKQAVGA